VILFVRPYEFVEELAALTSMALVAGSVTFAIYVVTQLYAEGTLTARVREIDLLLLLCVAGLASIPLAISREEAWATFLSPFARAVAVFIVIVNVVRTERRLRTLLWIALAVSVYLSAGAIQDHSMGRHAVESYRVEGRIGGLFSNPNELALHLVTMIPIAVGLLLAAPTPLGRLLYGASAVLMVAGAVVTYSRAGYLGLAAVGIVLARKLGRGSRTGMAVLLVCIVAVLALAPTQFGNRLGQIVDPASDPTGSASLRTIQLLRSIYTAVTNPFFGIGMGNFHFVSLREQGTHNAYTQVASEMGFVALGLYLLFLLAPLKGLRDIERLTVSMARGGPAGAQRRPINEASPERFFYLAVGLEASLIGYMVCSFFAHVAYHWYLYYLVGYAVCLRRLLTDDPRPTTNDQRPGTRHQALSTQRQKARQL
jgi:O-antigen ligase